MLNVSFSYKNPPFESMYNGRHAFRKRSALCKRSAFRYLLFL
ncbi:hypothetical protein HMPREF1548_05316 [Clostridium sp. KLE 1755]|nr:hypothetical protein HMPREF1548_05316 [Clostridium sp. KLE 1755]